MYILQSEKCLSGENVHCDRCMWFYFSNSRIEFMHANIILLFLLAYMILIGKVVKYCGQYTYMVLFPFFTKSTQYRKKKTFHA